MYMYLKLICVVKFFFGAVNQLKSLNFIATHANNKKDHRTRNTL